MKYHVLISLACSLMMLLCWTDAAQSQDLFPVESAGSGLLRKVKLIVGYSQPLGAFADHDISSSNSGYANPGGVLGLEYDHEVATHYDVAFSALGQFHSQNDIEWKNAFPWFSYKSDVRQVYSAMIGPFCDTHALNDVVLFASPQIGAVYSNYPNITITDYTIQSIEFKASWATTIGYKLSLGAMWRIYDFGFQFLYASPTYNPTYQYRRQTGDFIPEVKPMKAIFFTGGFILN